MLLLREDKTTIVGGDFNLCFYEKNLNPFPKHMSSLGFKQIVDEPTHIEGGLIDHCYVSGNNLVERLEVSQKVKYLHFPHIQDSNAGLLLEPIFSSLGVISKEMFFHL